jgi:4-diphosphocytidyl-2-C-methyl-D-erythritol kinase
VNAWKRALAPAKLNLRLEVLGKRADGFHELDTDLLAIDLVDELRARAVPGSDLHLELSGPALSDDVPADERNLAWRAARRVQREAQARGRSAVGLEFELFKSIPSRAGLGGASSDAVAALLLADALLELELGAERLGELAAELGSDCRFFLYAHSGRARCTGRGEIVEPKPPAPSSWWIALVTPEAHCSTPDVFGALRFPLPELESGAPLRIESEALPDAPRLGNHLQSAAFRAVADFAPWSVVLSGPCGTGWQLSGSGSSVFALFPAREVAQLALDALCGAAREGGLKVRYAALARPAGHGARLVE